MLRKTRAAGAYRPAASADWRWALRASIAMRASGFLSALSCVFASSSVRSSPDRRRTARRGQTVPASRSRSIQRSPSAWPQRRRVVRYTTHSASSGSPAIERSKARASSGLNGSGRFALGRRGAAARAATFRASPACLTARCRARRRRLYEGSDPRPAWLPETPDMGGCQIAERDSTEGRDDVVADSTSVVQPGSRPGSAVKARRHSLPR